MEIKIADTGEVLYRSPGVFLKYYKNDEATRATKTADGWVHTGDAGFFDQRGHLKIIDRAKDVGPPQQRRAVRAEVPREQASSSTPRSARRWPSARGATT